ncbi:MAG: hypothetical protein HN742_40275 [Lentisphaerae bacterium]|nr:hypothetical protein [Lentisphaerota bacterium]MBT7848173.1 hypothetical protein [Lentisphaerota bacterium]
MSHCASVGIALDELLRESGRHPAFIRRWLNGERTSDPLDRWVAERIGIRIEIMRALKP